MISTPEFSDRVQTTWLEPFAHLRQLVGNDTLLVAVDPELGSSRRCRLLHFDTGALCVTLSDELANDIEPLLYPDCDVEGFLAALDTAGVGLSEAESEEIFYFTVEDEEGILADHDLAEVGEEFRPEAGSDVSEATDDAAGEDATEDAAPEDAAPEDSASDDSTEGSGIDDALEDPDLAVSIRVLGAADIKDFAVFQAANSADDLDEAFVELDHWAVVGAYAADGNLVAVATAYPWRDHPVADVGVLTSPDHRGQKLGSAVVRAVAQRVLRRGFSPQYRCEGDNDASKATAASAGFSHFATLRIIR